MEVFLKALPGGTSGCLERFVYGRSSLEIDDPYYIYVCLFKLQYITQSKNLFLVYISLYIYVHVYL